MRFPSLEKCIWGSLELKHLLHEFRRFRELDSVRGMWARTPAKLKQLLNAFSKPCKMHLVLPGTKALQHDLLKLVPKPEHTRNPPRTCRNLSLLELPGTRPEPAGTHCQTDLEPGLPVNIAEPPKTRRNPLRNRLGPARIHSPRTNLPKPVAERFRKRTHCGTAAKPAGPPRRTCQEPIAQRSLPESIAKPPRKIAGTAPPTAATCRNPLRNRPKTHCGTARNLPEPIAEPPGNCQNPFGKPLREPARTHCGTATNLPEPQCGTLEPQFAPNCTSAEPIAYTVGEKP